MIASRDGEIGRRSGLKIRRGESSVGVRFPLPAPSQPQPFHLLHDGFRSSAGVLPGLPFVIPQPRFGADPAFVRERRSLLLEPESQGWVFLKELAALPAPESNSLFSSALFPAPSSARLCLAEKSRSL